LLCSDIHRNAEALAAALAEPADAVLCAGDLVHFGPQPTACIELIREHAGVVVRGNHDHGAARGEDCRTYGPWCAIDDESRAVVDRTISEAHRQYLRSLPLTDTITVGGTRFMVVHAAPSDPLYRYLRPDTPEDVWHTELGLVEADVLVLGHTHLPLLRTTNRPVVVNPGSVGLPRDGDPRARYAVWEDGVIRPSAQAYDQIPLWKALAALDLPSAALQRTTNLFQGHAPGGPNSTRR